MSKGGPAASWKALRKEMSKPYKRNDPFYTSGAWRAVRQLALERDHFYCQDCLRLWEMGKLDKPKTAAMVHHLLPREKYPELELDLDNLISLCDAHHNQRHPERGFQPERKARESARRCVRIGNDISMDREETPPNEPDGKHA